jgi:hypothetical protein
MSFALTANVDVFNTYLGCAVLGRQGVDMEKAVVKRIVALCGLLVVLTIAVGAQKTANTGPAVEHILWEPVDITQRDLFLGPGGVEFQPKLERVTFLGVQPGGTRIKYRVRDAKGREWVVKMGRETQPEVAAVRLLWGIGYKTEINYMIRDMQIVQKGNFHNVRAEARPEKLKRIGTWSWSDHPFMDKNEFYGLKLMMAMLNNWDIKDENNVVLRDGDKHYYVISDLGTSFGKTADEKGGRGGRSVNNPEDYSKTPFIQGVRDGQIELVFNTFNDHLIHGVKVEHGRWLADLLMQLSDKQISDAFRAANYKPEEITILTNAFRKRINELDAATKPVVAIQ